MKRIKHINVVGQKTTGEAEQRGTVDTEQELQAAPDNSQVMMEMDTDPVVDSDSVSQNTDKCSLLLDDKKSHRLRKCNRIAKKVRGSKRLKKMKFPV